MNRCCTKSNPVAQSASLLFGLALITQLIVSASAANSDAVRVPVGKSVPGKSTASKNVAAALLNKAKAELAAGKIEQAIDSLNGATKLLGVTQASSEAHFLLGQALCLKAKKLKQVKNDTEANNAYLVARKELRQAVRAGRGNAIAIRANAYMISSLPTNLHAPRTGEGTELIAARFGLHGQHRGAGRAVRAQIIEFFAPWCAPCQQLKPVLARVQKEYGDQVELKSFNVDDEASQDIVDQYEVSPIPTVIFLTAESKVVGYSIGFSGDKPIQKQLQRIFKNDAAGDVTEEKPSAALESQSEPAAKITQPANPESERAALEPSETQSVSKDGGTPPSANNATGCAESDLTKTTKSAEKNTAADKPKD